MSPGTKLAKSGALVLGAVVGVVALIAIAKKAAEEVTEAVVETVLEVIDNRNNNTTKLCCSPGVLSKSEFDLKPDPFALESRTNKLTGITTTSP